MKTGEVLEFNTQGNEFSYHAAAARLLAVGLSVEIFDRKSFTDIISATRDGIPDLGVLAVSTVEGVVDDSVRELVRQRPSELPPIVARVDVPVPLYLIGTDVHDPKDLNLKGRNMGQGVRCLAQRAAWKQSAGYFEQHHPLITWNPRDESTRAIQEVIDRNSPKYVAIGPPQAAEAMGAVILSDTPVNPPNSVTSFLAAQRDPFMSLLPKDPEKIVRHTVITLAYPEDDGAFRQCMEVADRLGVNITRYIPFPKGDFTRYRPDVMRLGGLIEVAHDIYEPLTYEFCAEINKLKDCTDTQGPFNTDRLGGYDWYPEDFISSSELADQEEQRLARVGEVVTKVD